MLSFTFFLLSRLTLCKGAKVTVSEVLADNCSSILDLILHNTLCLKNIPSLARYDFDIHEPVVIIFARSVVVTVVVVVVAAAAVAAAAVVTCFPSSTLTVFSKVSCCEI